MHPIPLRTEVERAGAIERLRRLDLSLRPPWEMILQRRRQRRSLEQNRRYWAVLREIAAGLWLPDPQTGRQRRYADTALHLYFRGLFIGWDELVLPDGRVHLEPISTTTLSVGEFAVYLTQIDAWAAGHGVQLQECRADLAAWAEQAREFEERTNR